MKLRTLLGLCALLALTVGVATMSASAGGPPIVNTNTHFLNEPFTDPADFDCATGQLALGTGAFSGAIHVVIKAEGSGLVSSHVRGTTSLDDYLPTADGVPDATGTFSFNSEDHVTSAGGEVHHFTGTGTLTITATGQKVQFVVIEQAVIDASGNAKVDSVHFRCD
jgi:hypothetical protein